MEWGLRCDTSTSATTAYPVPDKGRLFVKDPHLPTPVAVPLGRPGILALTVPKRRVSDTRDALPSLRFGETRVLSFCVPWSPRSVPEHSFPIYVCPICIPRSRGYGSSSPNKVPKMESSPKLPWPRTKMPKSLKNLLPVFHFAVCVCLPNPYTNASRKGEKKVGGGDREQSSSPSGLWLRGSRGAPCPALR